MHLFIELFPVSRTMLMTKKQKLITIFHMGTFQFITRMASIGLRLQNNAITSTVALSK